jgi:hypothetical protein
MKTTLPFIFLLLALLGSKLAIASKPIVATKNDTSFKNERTLVARGMKICACQILEFQSANMRTRSYALLAERTSMRGYAYDVHRAKGTIEKEKKHLSEFFYDKLALVSDLVEITDCRTLFTKMKKKQRSLILYDILDADVKR